MVVLGYVVFVGRIDYVGVGHLGDAGIWVGWKDRGDSESGARGTGMTYTNQQATRDYIRDLVVDVRCAERDGHEDYALFCRRKVAALFARRHERADIVAPAVADDLAKWPMRY